MLSDVSRQTHFQKQKFLLINSQVMETDMKKKNMFLRHRGQSFTFFSSILSSVLTVRATWLLRSRELAGSEPRVGKSSPPTPPPAMKSIKVLFGLTKISFHLAALGLWEAVLALMRTTGARGALLGVFSRVRPIECVPGFRLAALNCRGSHRSRADLSRRASARTQLRLRSIPPYLFVCTQV